MISLLLASLMLQTGPVDRTYEGDWYVSDDTDNNTGQRKVYAFNSYIEGGEYVTLTMRCTAGKPTFFVDWDRATFPDQAVLTLGPAMEPDDEPAEHRYMFEKSREITEPGLRASPETSAQIIGNLGLAKYTSVTAHLASGTRTVGISIDGAQRAWSRVSRHCPIRTLPQPPI